MNPTENPTPANSDCQGSTESEIRRYDGGLGPQEADQVVVEEPLEIRVNSEPFATLLRTPGQDANLALGFLYAEGVIDCRKDIGALSLCGEDALAGPGGESDAPADDSLANIVDLLTTDPQRKITPPARQGVAVSSCGVCGKRSIAEAMALTPPPGPAPGSPPARWLEPGLIGNLPDRLKSRQEIFKRTGALHAAAVFNSQGKLLLLSEDIGRHNAVDKIIGAALLEEMLPLSQCILQVSGRVSFEIVQKAYRAGIPAISAVSGVSNLSISLARSTGLLLAGFVREEKYSLYSAGSCLLDDPPGELES